MKRGKYNIRYCKKCGRKKKPDENEGDLCNRCETDATIALGDIGDLSGEAYEASDDHRGF